MRRHTTNVIYPRLVESPVERTDEEEQTWQDARLNLILELSTRGIPLFPDPVSRTEPVEVRIVGIHGATPSLDQISRQRRWIRFTMEEIDL